VPFTRFFAAKFDELGLKKLISTSYAPDAKKMKLLPEPSLFETKKRVKLLHSGSSHGNRIVFPLNTLGSYSRYAFISISMGLKKLISTSYAPDAKKMKLLPEPSLFETEAPQFDPTKAQTAIESSFP